MEFRKKEFEKTTKRRKVRDLKLTRYGVRIGEIEKTDVRRDILTPKFPGKH